MTRATAVVLFTIVIGAPAAAQTCVQYYVYGVGTGSTIGVQPGTGWGEDPPPIDTATMLWNEGCPQAGTGFPFLLPNMDGDITVTVSRIHGQSTEDPGTCAYFSHSLGPNNQVIGGDIKIFTTDRYGADCTWMLPHVTLSGLIGHELGHVLGLANSLCSNNIMGPDWPSCAPSGDECQKVAEFWTPVTEPPPDDDPPHEYLPLEQGLGDPLILDLNGDGIHTTSLASPVLFDARGDGNLVEMAWTHPNTVEAFLWVDLGRNNKVDDGRELFGTGTVLPSGERAVHGFEALAVYDQPAHAGNADGRIDRSDRIWAKLRLWVDENHDGRSNEKEVAPIHRYGVFSIAIGSASEPPFVDINGNIHVIRTTFLRQVRGRIIEGAIHNVFFRVSESPSETP
jgi:hypothetical protein